MSAFPHVARQDEPTLLWLFNESSGTTAGDSSGNGRHGTVSLGTQGAWGATGAFLEDKGLRSGNGGGAPNDTTVKSTYNPFNNNGQQTFEFILKPEDLNLHDIMENDTGANSPQITYDADLNGGQIAWVPEFNPVTWRGLGDLTGAFHHYLFTIDNVNNLAAFWLDGRPYGEKVSVGNYNATPGNYSLNDSVTGGTAALRGVYDAVAVYDKKLTPDRIVEHAGAALPIAPGGGGRTPGTLPWQWSVR